MKAKFSAARSYAGDAAELVTNKGMQLMGSAGDAYESHLEKTLRD
jgi:alkylation response protein AidB-like acyl-CoA dehydrogenase